MLSTGAMSARSAKSNTDVLKDDAFLTTFPPRFSALKKEIWKSELIQSWKEVLLELEKATKEIISKGPEVSRSHLDTVDLSDPFEDDSSIHL